MQELVLESIRENAKKDYKKRQEENVPLASFSAAQSSGH